MTNTILDKIFVWSKQKGRKANIDLPYFIKNSFWITLKQIIASISGLLLFVAFTRLASQEVFGQYQFVLSVLSIISIVSIPGLSTSLVRSVARGHDGDYKNAVKNSFFWSLIGIPLLLIIGSYYYFYQNESIGIALMFSSITFPFLYAFKFWSSLLEGKSKFNFVTKYSSIQSIINALAVIVVIFLKRDDLLWIMAAYLLSHCMLNVFYFWRSLKFIENNKINEGTFSYGWFLTKINILGIIANNIDKILIGILLSSEALAVYVVVSFFAVKIKDLLRPLLNSLIPKISKAKYSLKNVVIEKKKMIFVALILNFTLSCIFVLLVSSVNAIFFGKNYQEYYELSRYFFFVVFFSPIIYFLSVFTRAKKNIEVITSVNLFQHSSRIALNFFLIYFWGLFGAVLAINITFILWFLAYVYFIYRKELKNKKRVA